MRMRSRDGTPHEALVWPSEILPASGAGLAYHHRGIDYVDPRQSVYARSPSLPVETRPRSCTGKDRAIVRIAFFPRFSHLPPSEACGKQVGY